MTRYVNTMPEMEYLYYGAGQPFIESQNLISPISGFNVAKDADVISTTSGFYNAVYGAFAHINLNLEANFYGMTAKYPYKKSGWRAVTAVSDTMPFGGVAEAGNLPATTKPTASEVSTKTRRIANVFGNDEMQEEYAKGGDDAYGSMAQLRLYKTEEHKKQVNEYLNQENGTPETTGFTSIDTVVADYAELSSYESDQGTSYSSGDLDIYGQDRDGGATTLLDAYVDDQTKSALVSLTDSKIMDLITNTRTSGARDVGQNFYSSISTWGVTNQLYETQARYPMTGEKFVSVGVNGIQSQPGSNAGFAVSSLYDMNFIQSVDAVSETGGIGRLYLLDSSSDPGSPEPRLGLRVMHPTQYFEAGMNNGTPFAINKFGTEGMYRTNAELICPFIGAQGKIRDIKA